MSRLVELEAAPVGDYPPEFVPNWGSMQFLVNILRPPDPAVYPNSKNESWFTTLKRAGGGCNDLIFSGHILVSVLTAMAWTVSEHLTFARQSGLQPFEHFRCSSTWVVPR